MNIMQQFPRYFTRINYNIIIKLKKAELWKYKPFFAKQVISNIFDKMDGVVKYINLLRLAIDKQTLIILTKLQY